MLAIYLLENKNFCINFFSQVFELTKKGKKNFTVKMLSNLFETDFKNKMMNKN